MHNNYNIDKFEPIHTKDYAELVDFFSNPGKKKIIIESNLNYLILSTSPNIDISIDTKNESIKSKIFGIFYSNSITTTKAKIDVNLKNNDTDAEVYLLSVTRENQSISVDGSINMDKGVKKVSGHLLEENLVFGDNISIKTRPILNIYSNDVKASHGARIEKIDTEKMFYLTSKGISGPGAEKLILEGYIDYILNHFKSIDMEEIKSKIIQK